MEVNSIGFLGKEFKEKEKESRLDYYKDIKAADGFIENYRFSVCDFEDSLIGYDEDVTIYLPVTELIDKRKDKPVYANFSNLDRVYNLKIIDINEEEKKVTVSFIAAQKVFKEKEIKRINAALEKGEHPVVLGTALALMTNEETGTKDAVLVDLLGLGIFGTIKISDWSDIYTLDLAHVVKNGDVLKVAIYEKKERAGMVTYKCSRKECANENLEEFFKKFPKGCGVAVKCVARGRKYFTGQLIGYKDILCLCRYPKHVEIEMGKTYTGFIASAEPGRSVQIKVGTEL